MVDVYGVSSGISAIALLMLFGGVLFVVLMVVLIVLAVRYLNRTNPQTHGPWPGQPAASAPAVPTRPEPLEILRDRFARGEITLDQFQNAKQALGYSSSPASPPPGPGATPTV